MWIGRPFCRTLIAGNRQRGSLIRCSRNGFQFCCPWTLSRLLFIQSPAGGFGKRLPELLTCRGKAKVRWRTGFATVHFQIGGYSLCHKSCPAVVRNQHVIQLGCNAWALLAHTVNRLLIWTAVPSLPRRSDTSTKRRRAPLRTGVPRRLPTACLFQSAVNTMVRTLLPTDPLCPTIHRSIASLMLARKVCHLNSTHLIRSLVSPCWVGHEFPCYGRRSTSRQLFLNRFSAKTSEVSQAPTNDSLH